MRTVRGLAGGLFKSFPVRPRSPSIWPPSPIRPSSADVREAVPSRRGTQQSARHSPAFPPGGLAELPVFTADAAACARAAASAPAAASRSAIRGARDGDVPREGGVPRSPAFARARAFHCPSPRHWQIHVHAREHINEPAPRPPARPASPFRTPRVCLRLLLFAARAPSMAASSSRSSGSGFRLAPAVVALACAFALGPTLQYGLGVAADSTDPCATGSG